MIMQPSSPQSFSRHYMPPPVASAKMLSDTTLVVPEWVATALRRNNLNLIELLNYGNLRKVLSVEDMAQYFSLNFVPEKVNFVLSSLGSGLLNVFEQHDAKPDQVKEMREIIHPLAMADSTLNEVLKRLESADNYFTVPGQETPVYHSVVFLHDGVSAFIIKRGFLDALKNRDYVLKVISDHLRVLYAKDTIQSVSSSVSFERYVKLLGDFVR